MRTLRKAAVFGFLILCAVAVGLGRMQGPDPSMRKMQSSDLVNVGYGGSGLLDVRSGRSLTLPMPAEDSLHEISLAPWQDRDGATQLVGRWTRRSGPGARSNIESYGLARYSYPSGAPLNQVVLDIIPSSPPCWFPGTLAQVIFAASDGQLYRFAFEGSTQADAGGDGCDVQPRALTWKTTRPGSGRVLLSYPTQVADRRLARILIATLRSQPFARRPRKLAPPELWWLQLNAEGTTIEAAGRLIAPESEGTDEDEGFASVTKTPEGDLLLAYLARQRGAFHWRLHLAPIRLDAATLKPSIRRGDVVDLAVEVSPAPPAFSPDAHWIYASLRNDPPGSLRRLPIDNPPTNRRPTDNHLVHAGGSSYR